MKKEKEMIKKLKEHFSKNNDIKQDDPEFNNRFKEWLNGVPIVDCT